jgi:leader peptidase (prepilin peptidase)/N-methyltransferase
VIELSFPLAVVFLTGLCIGSFLNVVIYRLPRRESFITGRSRCPLCGHTLAWYDLLPLLSFLFLLGRCRYCRAVISPRYPLIELLTGALFALLYLSFGLTAAFVKYAFFAAFLIIVSMIDLEHYIVPDRLVTAGLAGGILLGVFSKDRGLFSVLLGAGVAAGFLLLVALLSKGGMGGGDIKLAFVTGLFLGWPLGPLGIFLGSCLAGITGVFLLALRLKGRKDPIPFGPFIALGSLLSLLRGNELLAWYFRHLNW